MNMPTDMKLRANPFSDCMEEILAANPIVATLAKVTMTQGRSMGDKNVSVIRNLLPFLLQFWTSLQVKPPIMEPDVKVYVITCCKNPALWLYRNPYSGCQGEP